MRINKHEFERYEDVRVSGITNMFDVSKVMVISNLSREQCIFIMNNYSKLKEKFS